ncbi:uncharacterized protein [Mytilus edulis]|uniref:uncharacterized protein n=1 Tax=Mytilus edulis TaxID=6550 RepID=UPI0039F0EDE4
MWLCSTCYTENGVENNICSECHTERPQSRNSKAKVSPKESDTRELNARKECNVNEPIRVINKISDSERTNVKNENGYLDGMKQRPNQDPVMSRNQKECSPERPLDKDPKGKGRQSNTNQYHERPTEMYKNEGYNQQSNQNQRFYQPQNKYQGRPQGMHANQGYNQQPHQGLNKTPNQYHGRPQEMYANQGYNQQPHHHQEYNQQPNQHQGHNQQRNQHQGYNPQRNRHQGYNPQRNQHQGNNQPLNQFHGYNQPHQPQPYTQGLEGMMPPPLLPAQNMNPPQQNVTVVVLPIHVPSGSHSGQGLAPNPLVMPPYTPTISPQGNLNINDHQDSPQRDKQTPDREKQLKKKKGKTDKNKAEENKKQDPPRSEQTKQSELLLSEQEKEIKHQEDRERVRGPKIGKGGHGYNENKHEKLEDENVLGNQKRRGNGTDRGRVRGGNHQLGRANEQEDGEINDVDDIVVFKFLIKSFGGGCTFEDFLRRCDLFPKGSNICSWFKKHSKRFHVFWDENDIVYIQPFYQEAKICNHWNNKQNPGQCRNTSCDFFHICRHFIRGNCKESSCLLSHSLGNPHNQTIRDKLSFSDYSDVDIRVILNCNSLSVCADYVYNNGCKVENGEKRCPHLHLCEQKVFGNCEGQCKFMKNHSITQFHNKWVLGAWTMSRLPETQVFKYISVPPRQRKEFDDKSDDTELSQHVDDAVDTSVQSDSNVSASSESLSSTASCDPKIKKLITSGENRSKEDVNASEDSICGIVGKSNHCLPKVSAPQEKYDANDNITKDRIMMKKNKQEKQAATSGKVVKPKSPPKPSKLTPYDPDYQERHPDLLKDETENSKICIFVSKDKCPSALCKSLHLPSGIPYLWQIKIDKWFSLTLAENEKIEKGYCYLLDDESTEACEVKYNGSKYSYLISFSKMQATIYDVDGQPAVGDNQHDQWCNVRRLSTPSFTEKKMMVDSYLTQWRWYWKDYSKKWNMYDKDDIERKYQTKQNTYLHTMENNLSIYRIDFKKMIQVNVETYREQKITRRPLFVSKDDVNEKKFEKILKNVDVPLRRVPNYPNAKGDLYHYKHRVDDDDDLYKGSDFMDMDEKLVPLKTDRSDGH